MTKNKEQTFWDHIRELRRVLLVSFIAVIVSSMIVYGFFMDNVMNIITAPISRFGIVLRFTAVAEGFLAYLKVAAFAGVVIASPVVLWELLRFILPALYTHEKRIFFTLFLSGALLFLVGILFAYFLVLPIALKALLFTLSADLEPFITVNSYLGFIAKFLLPFGVVFQIPIFAVFATYLGLLTPEKLAAPRKWIIPICFLLAAFLTPPDVISQLLLGIPMWLLYEISIQLSKVVVKRKKKNGIDNEF